MKEHRGYQLRQTHEWMAEQLRKIGIDPDALDLEVVTWTAAKQFIRLKGRSLLVYDYFTGRAWSTQGALNYDPRKAEDGPGAFLKFLRAAYTLWESSRREPPPKD